MVEIGKYYWLLPLCGGILSIIGFLIPVWYSSTAWDENLWIWGLIEHISPSGSEFTLSPKELFIPSLITAILILLSSSTIVIKTIFMVRGKTILGLPSCRTISVFTLPFIRRTHLTVILIHTKTGTV